MFSRFHNVYLRYPYFIVIYFLVLNKYSFFHLKLFKNLMLCQGISLLHALCSKMEWSLFKCFGCFGRNVMKTVHLFFKDAQEEIWRGCFSTYRETSEFNTTWHKLILVREEGIEWMDCMSTQDHNLFYITIDASLSLHFV